MSQPFEFKNVRWLKHPRSGAEFAIAAADVTCKTCGHTWPAEPARDFDQTSYAGSLRVTCPSCGKNYAVPWPDII